MPSNDTGFTSVIDRLVARARRTPDAPLLRFYDNRGRVEASYTHGEAVAAMRSMSGFLRTRCGLSPGDTALLVYPPSLDFAIALLGCMHAGVVPAPVYPPNPFKLEEGADTFEPISRNCGARVALTNRLYARSRRVGRVRSFVSGRSKTGEQLEWISTDKVKPGRFAPAPGPAVGPGSLALLQYTSGSTSAPKGVMITHGNLLHQLDLNRDRLGMGPDSRMVSWVPQYHDFGLISGILSVTAGNGEFTMFSPLAFIEKPSLWFELITRHRATHVASPDFGYALAARKTTPEQRAGYDLSQVKVAMSAAEPVRASTIDRFADAFAVSGFRAEAFNPAYGLAEHTVGVTVGGTGRLRVDRAALAQGRVVEAGPGAEALALMGCGRADAGVVVAIVDPDDGTRQPEGRVGEIWCDSPSKAAGYFGQPELSLETFEARIEGEAGRGWLRTGDMGFLHQGELYICGRLKDMLILQGRNLYPQDVEDAARSAHPSIRPGGLAAFVLEHIGDDASDELVLYVELRSGRPTPEAGKDVVAAVQKAVRATCDVGCKTIVLGSRGLVRKTTSGKVKRRACKQAWQDGDRSAVWQVERFDAPASEAEPMPGLYDAPSADEDLGSLEAAIRRAAAELLDLPAPSHIDPSRPLFTQGLSSVLAVDLCARIGEIIGRSVPVAALFQNPSVEKLAAALADGNELGLDGDEVHDPLLELAEGARVIVVGGGPAGVTVARELIAKGLEVQLLEGEAEVGGKVVDVEIDSKRYELGQILFFTGYTRTLDRVSELDVPLAPGRLNNHVLTADGGVIPIPVDETSAWAEAALEAVGYRPDQADGLEDIPPELMVPLPEWMKAHDLPPMPPGVADLWTGFGYGRIDDDVPAFYLATILNVLVNNGIHVATLGGRNADLWQAEVDRLLEGDRFSLRTGVWVQGVESDADGARVTLADGQVLEADAVVVAVPPDVARQVLPSTHPAAELLGRFRTFEYVVTLADIEAPDWPQHAVLPHNLGPDRIGHMMDFQRPYGADGLFILSQSGRDAGGEVIDDATLDARLRADVEGAGGTLRGVPYRRRWTYFPHLDSADLKRGVMRDLYACRGRGRIVLAGSYFGMETLEHTVASSERLVRRRVAIDKAGAEIEAVLMDPVFGPAARIARDADAPVDRLEFGPWTVRPALPSDDVEIDRLDQEEYGWLGEDAVEGIDSIRHQIALLNGGDDAWLWVLERDGQMVGWYVLQPTAVEPKAFSSWAEATDSGRLTGTFDADGRNLYLVAAGVSSGLPKTAHELLALGAVRMMRARGMSVFFCCVGMPGFSGAHAATGIAPEAYAVQRHDDGTLVDPLLGFFEQLWPGEHRPGRFLRDGYPPDQFSAGHGVSSVVDIDDPGAAIDFMLVRLMKQRDALGL